MHFASRCDAGRSAMSASRSLAGEKRTMSSRPHRVSWALLPKTGERFSGPVPARKAAIITSVRAIAAELNERGIDRHPTDRDLAVQKFRCGHCGPIKTEILSLKPPRRPDVAVSKPIQTAERNGRSHPR